MVKSEIKCITGYALPYATMNQIKSSYFYNNIDPDHWAGFHEWEAVFDEVTMDGDKLHGYVEVDGNPAAYLIMSSGWDIHFGLVSGYQALYILPEHRTRRVQREVANLMRRMEHKEGCGLILDTRHVDGKLIQKLREVRRG